MKIEHLESHHYLIPLPETLTDSTHGEMTHFAVVIVRLLTDEGAEGIGYTYTVGSMGGSAIHAMAQNDLAPFLISKNPDQIEKLWDEMWWHMHYVGRGGIVSFAMAAIDIALWDLQAKLAGEPLWQHLGGTDNQVKAYAGGIDLLLPLDELREQTRRNLDKGFRAIKMKVGRQNISEDVERVAAMRELLGPDIPLMVDANMCWSVDQAIEASHAFAEHDVYWLEEPTIPDDMEGHARIQREGALPVASGENLHTVYEFEKLLAAGGAAFPGPDVANCGGITPWLKIARLAESRGLPVTTHGAHDLQVHLLAAIPNSSYLEAHGFGLDACIQHPLEIKEGFASAPSRPGHGVEFIWEALEAL
ncbi:MAG: mandelate racemase/muconate lactonizing enzyme family protein, partial [Planctomycetota bacterium]|nr:mandelate racemase/muconate lactonizing enzyme family protein [Planctomycetota bacterium]